MTSSALWSGLANRRTCSFPNWRRLNINGRELLYTDDAIPLRGYSTTDGGQIEIAESRGRDIERKKIVINDRIEGNVLPDFFTF